MTYLGWITYKIGTIFDGRVLRSLTGRGAKLLCRRLVRHLIVDSIIFCLSRLSLYIPNLLTSTITTTISLRLHSNMCVKTLDIVVERPQLSIPFISETPLDISEETSGLYPDMIVATKSRDF